MPIQIEQNDPETSLNEEATVSNTYSITSEEIPATAAAIQNPSQVHSLSSKSSKLPKSHNSNGAPIPSTSRKATQNSSSISSSSSSEEESSSSEVNDDDHQVTSVPQYPSSSINPNITFIVVSSNNQFRPGLILKVNVLQGGSKNRNFAIF